MKENHLHTVSIDRELVQYEQRDCEHARIACSIVTRGAFGTTPSPHRAGSPVGKLFDHSYKVFFPNFAMQREVAKNLADVPE